MIALGRLRQRVTIQQESRVDDGAGGYALSWQDVAVVWAAVEPTGGREIVFAGRVEARVTHRVILRYRADVTAAMRVVYDGRAFAVRAVVNLGERDRFTQLLVEEGGAV